MQTATSHYRGIYAARYEHSRQSNPKWRFEDETLRRVMAELQTHFQSVMDVPIGTGRFIRQFEELAAGVRIYGIDCSADMLRIAARKPGAKKIRLIQQDILGADLKVFADLIICFRFLNLIAWPAAENAISKLLQAANLYALLAIRLVDESYHGNLFIEDKIFLHRQSAVESLVAGSDFEIRTAYEYQDERPGRYFILLCQRQTKILSLRVNKNRRHIYTCGWSRPRGKTYQVHNEAHAAFIERMSNDSQIMALLPAVRKVSGNFVDALWMDGDLLPDRDWEQFVELLSVMQSAPCPVPSSFDYVSDLVIPRFYNAHPLIGMQLYEDTVRRIEDGGHKYSKKISHPDVIPGNVVRKADRLLVIDNELMCCTVHHRIDLLNLLNNLPFAYRKPALTRYLDLCGIDPAEIQSERSYLHALWMARQAGSYLAQGKVEGAVAVVEAYKSNRNILPVALEDPSKPR